MIWKTTDVVAAASVAKPFIQQLIQQHIHEEHDLLSPEECSFAIGIIGGGPKGLYAVEELLNSLGGDMTDTSYHILWWNKDDNFGSGPNYQVDQKDFLLINYCIGHIDAWDRTRSTNLEHLHFMQWINIFKKLDIEVKPTDYASRALVGMYLQSVTKQVLAAKPKNVRLTLIAEEVNNIVPNAQAKLLIESDNHVVELDNIMLCTGHCYDNIPWLDFHDAPMPKAYFNTAYPLHNLEEIGASKKVGVIGWGLTFIDVALYLTEGIGGVFDDNFNYYPSGKEPILIPFSRHQLPIIPRGPIFGENNYTLTYLNSSWLQAMLAVKKQRKINFKTEIYPLLEEEIAFAYYSTLLQTKEVASVQAYIAKELENDRFTIDKLLYPHIPKHKTVQDTYIHYIAFLISEAEKGELDSPLMAAAAVWREASPLFAKLYCDGGFTGESQEFFDKTLFGAFCRTSYGPPIENMRKINGLLKAGIIQVLSENAIQLGYSADDELFVLQSNETVQYVDYIVDARVARPNLQHQNSSLYKNLLTTHIVQPFINQGYGPGCIAMDEEGKIPLEDYVTSIYAYGSNTEGVLLDNDSLSREKNNLLGFWIKDVQLKSLNPFNYAIK